MEKRILEILKERKVMSIKDLSSSLGLPEEDVKMAVERMEKDGLIRAIEVFGPPSIALTAKGEKQLSSGERG